MLQRHFRAREDPCPLGGRYESWSDNYIFGSARLGSFTSCIWNLGLQSKEFIKGCHGQKFSPVAEAPQDRLLCWNDPGRHSMQLLGEGHTASSPWRLQGHRFGAVWIRKVGTWQLDHLVLPEATIHQAEGLSNTSILFIGQQLDVQLPRQRNQLPIPKLGFLQIHGIVGFIRVQVPHADHLVV